jgi:uncharacterized protein (DUF1697 family)
MSRRVVLLRGVNLVRTNRVPMAKLRQVLEQAGFGDVRTYVQSGNIVLTRKASPDRIAERVRALIKKEFGHDIAVVVRSHAELVRIVKRNPLKNMATNPRRYLVTFLDGRLPRGFAAGLESVAKQELFAIVGSEVYSWHPDGIGRTPLWERLASRSLGVTGTSRNWATVTTLVAMSQDESDR